MIALLARLLGLTAPTAAQLDALDAYMDSLS